MNKTVATHRLIQETSPTKKIEQIARVCYKSEDKITEGSDFKMIKSLVARRHMAMMEHADVCIEVDAATYGFMETMQNLITKHIRKDDKESKRCYLRFSECFVESEKINDNESIYIPGRRLISGNMRAWAETFEELERMQSLMPELCNAVVDAAGGNTGALYQFYGHGNDMSNQDFLKGRKIEINVIDDFNLLSNEERMLHETLTVLFTCDRGVSHELVRMRECSFAQESTRYCNYGTQAKHNEEIMVIDPLFFDEGTEAYKEWEQAMIDAEKHYLRLTQDLKVPAQQARSVLPHSTKVDIVMTANLREWKHIFELRACDSTGPCHPQMSEIMQPCLRDVRELYQFAFGDLVMPNEVLS